MRVSRASSWWLLTSCRPSLPSACLWLWRWWVVTDFRLLTSTYPSPPLDSWCVASSRSCLFFFSFSFYCLSLNLTATVSLISLSLSQWNIADYLYQNRTTLKDSLEALRTETGQTGLTTGQKADDSLVSSFIKGVRNSSLLVFSSVWMLLFRYIEV